MISQIVFFAVDPDACGRVNAKPRYKPLGTLKADIDVGVDGKLFALADGDDHRRCGSFVDLDSSGRPANAQKLDPVRGTVKYDGLADSAI